MGFKLRHQASGGVGRFGLFPGSGVAMVANSKDAALRHKLRGRLYDAAIFKGKSVYSGIGTSQDFSSLKI
jgi:hypothetical protein